MTDRELLELAAKAGAPKAPGYTQGWRYSKNGRHGEGMYAASDRTELRFWNPLTDDGDALRLAVKLRMDVEPWVHGDSACARVGCGEILVDEPHYGDDPERATRRAIVRAAAEIGKAMP